MRKVIVPNAVLLAEAVGMLSNQHTVCIRAKGRSMLPFIVSGRDSVILQQPRALHRGDIVLAEATQGNYVLHRIVHITSDQVTLMGDGNLIQKEQCSVEQIRAIAIKVIRNGKYIDCNASSERWKVCLWMALLPVRRYLLAIYNRINRQ